jgi:hypothetical protein
VVTGHALFLSEVSGNQPAAGDPKFLWLVKEKEIIASDLQRSGYTQRLIPVERLDCNGMTEYLKSDHQYVSSDVRRLCDGLIPHSRKKHLLRKRKKKKWDRSIR